MRRTATRRVRSGQEATLARLLASKAGVGIDLGCGLKKQPRFVGVDARPLPDVDIVHDLETFPWPLPTACAHSVLCYHLFEHLKPWHAFQFMAEVHRICQPGAQVFLAGPYALDFRFVQDPTHTLPVNEATFYYWDKLGAPVLWEVYQQPVFHVIRFERIPVGNGVDYNASLQCCKDPKTCETCVANAKAVRAAEKGAKR